MQRLLLPHLPPLLDVGILRYIKTAIAATVERLYLDVGILRHIKTAIAAMIGRLYLNVGILRHIKIFMLGFNGMFMAFFLLLDSFFGASQVMAFLRREARTAKMIQYYPCINLYPTVLHR